MIPVLYPATETTFVNNGLGGLPDAISCVVTEQRNTQGGYWLEMDYPIDGLHYADIAPERIIYAAPFMGATPQPFRISRINRPIDGIVHIEAPHISAQLQKITTVGTFTARSFTGVTYDFAQAARGLGQTFPFFFSTDKTFTETQISFPEPTPFANVLLGAEGSILDTFGGEYEWNGREVILHDQRGVDSGLEIRYGVNMSDIEAETDATELVTAVVPFWKGTVNDADVVVIGDMCTATNAGAYAYVRCVPLDVSDQFDSDQQPTKTEVNEKGTAFINGTGRKLLQTSIKVKYEPTTNGIGERLINLCDTVRVVYPDLNVSSISKVVETRFNVLTEQYDELTIGSIRNNIVDTIAGLISGGAITGGGGSSGGGGGSAVGAVLYNMPQSLNEAQKAQARSNIGVGSGGETLLPEVTAEDNGKVLGVVDGAWGLKIDETMATGKRVAFVNQADSLADPNRFWILYFNESLSSLKWTPFFLEESSGEVGTVSFTNPAAKIMDAGMRWALFFTEPISSLIWKPYFQVDGQTGIIEFTNDTSNTADVEVRWILYFTEPISSLRWTPFFNDDTGSFSWELYRTTNGENAELGSELTVIDSGTSNVGDTLVFDTFTRANAIGIRTTGTLKQGYTIPSAASHQNAKFGRYSYGAISTTDYGCSAGYFVIDKPESATTETFEWELYETTNGENAGIGSALTLLDSGVATVGDSLSFSSFDMRNVVAIKTTAPTRLCYSVSADAERRYSYFGLLKSGSIASQPYGCMAGEFTVEKVEGSQSVGTFSWELYETTNGSDVELGSALTVIDSGTANIGDTLSFDDFTQRNAVGIRTNAPLKAYYTRISNAERPSARLGLKSSDGIGTQGYGCAAGNFVITKPIEESTETTSRFNGLSISFYGDSITENNFRYDKGYRDWVVELLNFGSQHNYGHGGDGIEEMIDVVTTHINSGDDNSDVICLMIGTNDIQNYSYEYLGDETSTVPFTTTKVIDPDTGKVISKTPQGGTIYGSFYQLCTLLTENYADRKIIMITPHDAKAIRENRITTYDYARAMKNMCERFCIPVYDNRIFSGIFRTNKQLYTSDGIHWTDRTHEIVGRNLAKWMQDTFVDMM